VSSDGLLFSVGVFSAFLLSAEVEQPAVNGQIAAAKAIAKIKSFFIL